MTRILATLAAILALGTGAAHAAEPPPDSAGPVKLTDHELDEVVAGDPLIFVNLAAPVSVHIEPISVAVNVPVNVAAIVQANVLGNAVMEAIAVGTQNVYNAAAAFPTAR